MGQYLFKMVALMKGCYTLLMAHLSPVYVRLVRIVTASTSSSTPYPRRGSPPEHQSHTLHVRAS